MKTKKEKHTNKAATLSIKVALWLARYEVTTDFLVVMRAKNEKIAKKYDHNGMWAADKPSNITSIKNKDKLKKFT